MVSSQPTCCCMTGNRSELRGGAGGSIGFSVRYQGELLTVSLCALDVSNRTTRTRTRQHELKREHELVVYCFGSNFSNSVIGVLSR